MVETLELKIYLGYILERIANENISEMIINNDLRSIEQTLNNLVFTYSSLKKLSDTDEEIELIKLKTKLIEKYDFLSSYLRKIKNIDNNKVLVFGGINNGSEKKSNK